MSASDSKRIYPACAPFLTFCLLRRNFTELDLPFSFSASDPRPSITPTPEQYAFLQSRSPITLAHQVKAHTLLLVGLEDRRVPPSQAKGECRLADTTFDFV